MTAPWREYQVEVAKLYRSLGCTVELEKKVAGARGVHAIDVLALRTTFGVTVTWIVECKVWNTAVSKEKVLALGQIAADVGADRAFLLSESGFQAGALRVAQNTNITLTSLQDLRDNAQVEMDQRELLALAQRAHALQRQLHDLPILEDGSPGSRPGVDQESMIDLLSRVFELKTIALPKAQSGEFPINLSSVGQVYDNAAAFISAADAELQHVMARIDSTRDEISRVRSRARPKVVTLAATIAEFLNATEAILVAGDPANVSQPILETALAQMRQVGTNADELRNLVSGQPSLALSTTMRALIDGPYALLAEMQNDERQWRQSRRAVENAVKALVSLFPPEAHAAA